MIDDHVEDRQVPGDIPLSRQPIAGLGFAAFAVDPQSANSVSNLPILGGDYRFSTSDRALSGLFDTIDDTSFFIGRMNSQSLLDAVLSNN